MSMRYFKTLNAIEKPERLLPWLLNQQSMTDKLKNETRVPVRLSVLKEWWGAVESWEKTVLQMEDAILFRREITISAGTHLCWFARTLIPKTTYQSYEDVFQRLQKESLGEIIFSDKRIVRGSLISYPINARSVEYHWLEDCSIPNAEADLWLRLSEFSIEGSHFFYLVEILLPGLEIVTSG